jgi:hypothetical protein
VEGEAMTSLQQTEELEQCRNCSNWTSAGDRFCRKCGIQRFVCGMQETTPLRVDEQSVSSRSLNRLQHHVVQTTGSLHLNRIGGIVVAVLISIPMWLLIVLLSPIEAYSSARAASSQLTMQ